MIVRRLMTMLERQRDRRGSPMVAGKGCEFEVNTRALSLFVVERLLPIAGVSPFPLDELMLMSAAVCRIRPKHIFEWGTNVGKSARIFAEVSKWAGSGTVVHSIDLPDDVSHVEHPGRRRGEMVRGVKEVRLYQGDGLTVATETGRRLRDQAPFLFFLDGDHGYETVLKELVVVIGEFPSSSVLVHDTLYQSPEADYNVGPHRAIAEVMRTYGEGYRVISANIGLPGMTLLYRTER